MRRWIAVSILGACLLAAGLLVAVTPRRTVADLVIQETLFDSQTTLQNYRYRLSIRGVLAGDNDAFARLVKFSCSGAGCYEHGEVLAAILVRIGDVRFTRLAETLSREDQKLLLDLLAAGFEYGAISMNERLPNFSKAYPQLSELLRNINDYAILR